MSLQIQPLEKPITATVSIPGSKSYTNRALIMAALTKGEVTISNPLFSDDTKAMISCLRALGIEIEEHVDSIIVKNDISQIQQTNCQLDANISGTTIRFILALACLVPGTKTVFGKEGLNKRPIGELVEGLRQLGANIEYQDKEGYPPLKVTSPRLSNGTTRLNGDISSQYFTALLMIAPAIGGLTIEVIGNQISKSYIDMTIDMMQQWGVTVQNENYQKYSIPPGQEYMMKNYIVEGDYSGAGYFLAIAALTNSIITLKNLRSDSKQGDKNFMHILEKMGSMITPGENEVTIKGNGIKPLNVDMELCPDQAQTLAVLAAFAQGMSKMTGVRSLRVKETERVKATQAELAKMGIKTESPDNDTLIIYGGNPQPAAIDTYGDHRMAMSFSVAGTKIDGIQINNPEVVNKTFPDFWKKLQDIGVSTM